MIELALAGFESPSNSLNLPPDIDEGFGVAASGNAGILEVGEHEIKFGGREKIYALLQMPRISPPNPFHQGIPFGHSLRFGFGQFEDVPELFFKEEDFLYGSSLVDFDYSRDEEMIFLGPSVHLLQKTPFHLPKFFPMQGPAFSPE